jgi:hypothetical protein
MRPFDLPNMEKARSLMLVAPFMMYPRIQQHISNKDGRVTFWSQIRSAVQALGDCYRQLMHYDYRGMLELLELL